MSFQKLRQIDHTTAGIGIPKAVLERMGLVDHDGDASKLELRERPQFQVIYEGDGRIVLQCMSATADDGDRVSATDD